MPTKRLRYGSVCSGIEAATVAWKPLGWKSQWFAEIDSFPSAVLKHHYPKTRNYGDFTKIGSDASAIDVLVGGTPCQSFSVAGLRGGMADERGNLALEFLKLADRTRPRWVVWENVPGVLFSVCHDAPDPLPPQNPVDLGCDGAEVETEDEYDSEELHAFNCFLAGLAELGYGFAYRILDAQHFGIPQRRRRVFVVGYLGDWRRAAAVLFERQSLSGDSPPRRKTGESVTGSLASRASAGGGLGTDFDCAGGVIGTLSCNTGPRGHDAGNFASNQGVDAGFVIPILEAGARTGTLRARTQESYEHLAASTGNISHCLNTGGRLNYETETLVTHSLRADGFDASEDGTGRGTPLVAHSLAIRGRDGVPQIEMGDEVANAILTPNGGRGGVGVGAMMQGSAVRRLTPVECERLQGFKDNYTGIPYRGKPAADGNRYKALGNSMAVPCMAFIGKRIQMVEDMA